MTRPLTSPVACTPGMAMGFPVMVLVTVLITDTEGSPEFGKEYRYTSLLSGLTTKEWRSELTGIEAVTVLVAVLMTSTVS